MCVFHRDNILHFGFCGFCELPWFAWYYDFVTELYFQYTFYAAVLGAIHELCARLGGRPQTKSHFSSARTEFQASTNFILSM